MAKFPSHVQKQFFFDFNHAVSTALAVARATSVISAMSMSRLSWMP